MTDKLFWKNRYQQNQTGWDLGQPSQPLMELMKSCSDFGAKILIPGCGNGYEAAALWELGFKHIWMVDIAEEAIESMRNRMPQFPHNQLVCADFFKWNEQHFDVVLEQTFFCAIDPQLRQSYADEMSRKIKSGGMLMGVFFNRTFDGGPPFGGNEKEYEAYFSPYFDFILWEECPCSVPPRAGTEWWFQLRRK